MAVTLSTGPDLAKEEKGVHIIFVADDAVHAVSAADPTAAEMKQVATHIGKPKATDVIVFGGNPWHFAGGELRKHPEVHRQFPETVLKLFRKTQDRAVWWSEHEFRITGIEKEEPENDGTAAYPFAFAPEARLQPISGQRIWVARSSVPVNDAYGQEYKITFTIEGRTIDPNMECVGN